MSEKGNKAAPRASGKAGKTKSGGTTTPPVAVDTTPQGGGRGRPPKNKAAAPLPPIASIGIDAPFRHNDGPGRPSDFRPEFVKIARSMAKLGGTDFEISEELGVKTSTVWRWRSKYPEFCSAISEGKEAWDDRVERSLAQRAVGYSYHSEKVMQFEGQVVRAQIVEHVPPDVSAIRLWLMNRRPDKWRDKREAKLDGSEAFLNLWRAISSGAVPA